MGKFLKKLIEELGLIRSYLEIIFSCFAGDASIMKNCVAFKTVREPGIPA